MKEDNVFLRFLLACWIPLENAFAVYLPPCLLYLSNENSEDGATNTARDGGFVFLYVNEIFAAAEVLGNLICLFFTRVFVFEGK